MCFYELMRVHLWIQVHLTARVCVLVCVCVLRVCSIFLSAREDLPGPSNAVEIDEKRSERREDGAAVRTCHVLKINLFLFLKLQVGFYLLLGDNVFTCRSMCRSGDFNRTIINSSFEVTLD